MTDETLKRDKLLLDLMMHNYDEEVQRNELIDSKNSQMIILSGAMLTLQASIFTSCLLNEFIYTHIYPLKNWIFGLFIGSLLVGVTSMICFILAYKFVGKFHQAPTANYIKKSYNKNKSNSEILDDIFNKLPDRTINKNRKLMTRKVNIGNIGFIFLIINIILLLSFVSLLIYCFTL